jgi:hypothetical protein
VDPIQEAMNPQQDNGYSYAWNDPATISDPTGLRPACDSGPCDKNGNSRQPAPPTHSSPNSCIEMNGGDWNACNVGNTGSGGGAYSRNIVGAKTPNSCIQQNGGDWNACNVGNTGSGTTSYAPVPPPPPTYQAIPPKQPHHHCGFTCGFTHVVHSAAHLAETVVRKDAQLTAEVGRFAWDHRAIIAQTLAFGACLVVSAVICIVAGIASALVSNYSLDKGLNVKGFLIDSAVSVAGGVLGGALGGWRVADSAIARAGQHASDLRPGSLDLPLTVRSISINEIIGANGVAAAAIGHHYYD